MFEVSFFVIWFVSNAEIQILNMKGLSFHENVSSENVSDGSDQMVAFRNISLRFSVKDRNIFSPIVCAFFSITLLLTLFSLSCYGLSTSSSGVL